MGRPRGAAREAHPCASAGAASSDVGCLRLSPPSPARTGPTDSRVIVASAHARPCHEGPECAGALWELSGAQGEASRPWRACGHQAWTGVPLHAAPAATPHSRTRSSGSTPASFPAWSASPRSRAWCPGGHRRRWTRRSPSRREQPHPVALRHGPRHNARLVRGPRGPGRGSRARSGRVGTYAPSRPSPPTGRRRPAAPGATRRWRSSGGGAPSHPGSSWAIWLVTGCSRALPNGTPVSARQSAWAVSYGTAVPNCAAAVCLSSGWHPATTPNAASQGERPTRQDRQEPEGRSSWTGPPRVATVRQPRARARNPPGPLAQAPGVRACAPRGMGATIGSVRPPVRCGRTSHTVAGTPVRVDGGSCHRCARLSSQGAKRLGSCWRQGLQGVLARTSWHAITSAAPRGDSSCGRMQ